VIKVKAGLDVEEVPTYCKQFWQGCLSILRVCNHVIRRHVKVYSEMQDALAPFPNDRYLKGTGCFSELE